VCLNASWRKLKRPHAPGMAKAMDCSLPRVWCHFSREVHQGVVGMLVRISPSQIWWCAGKVMVMAFVSIVHPRMVLVVL